MLTRAQVAKARNIKPHPWMRLHAEQMRWNCGAHIISANSLFNLHVARPKVSLAALLKSNPSVRKAVFCTTARQPNIAKYLKKAGAKLVCTFAGSHGRYRAQMWQLVE